MDEETVYAVTNLRHYGVEHRNVRPPNILWNPEERKVMLVDFECSEILKQAPILQEISPNRKRKYPHSIEGACIVDHLISVSLKLQNVAYRHPSF
jgi:hypothetical protein